MDVYLGINCLFIALLILISAADNTLIYDNHKLLRVYPTNQYHLTQLTSLHEAPAIKAEVLKEPTLDLNPIDLIIHNQHIPQTLDLLSDLKLRHEVLLENIQRLLDIDKQLNNEAVLHRGSQPYDFSHYMDYNQIVSWMEDFVQTCPAGLTCDIINFGRSFQNRTLLGVKVSSGGDKKPGFWVDGGIHAREWITPAVVLYVMQKLVDGYSGSKAVMRLLDKWDFYFFPVINADGYQYTWDVDRLWRKSRSYNKESGCYGTDLNRNFGFYWNRSANNDPCSSTFAGTAAFSEVETRSVRDFIFKSGVKFDVFITTHSYGQLLLLPYGYTTRKPHNYKALMKVGLIWREAVYKQYATDYGVDSASRILYKSYGTSRDWAYGEVHIPYVYTIELRDKGEWGFLLPPGQIQPTGAESWEGLLAMGIKIINNLRS